MDAAVMLAASVVAVASDVTQDGTVSTSTAAHIHVIIIIIIHNKKN